MRRYMRLWMPLITALTVGGLTACDYYVHRGCPVFNSWTVSGSARVNTPASCPIVQRPGEDVNLHATVEVIHATPLPYIGIYAYDHFNAPLRSGTAQWFCQTSSCWYHVSFPVISYPMSMGHPSGFIDGKDRIFFVFEACDGSPCYGPWFEQVSQADISYTAGSKARIQGPGIELLPHLDFSISASLHDPNVIPPVSLSWTLNGQPLSDTTEVISGNTGHQGTWFNYEATYSGANGTSASATTSFYTKLCDFPGCADMRRVGPPPATGASMRLP